MTACAFAAKYRNQSTTSSIVRDHIGPRVTRQARHASSASSSWRTFHGARNAAWPAQRARRNRSEHGFRRSRAHAWWSQRAWVVVGSIRLRGPAWNHAHEVDSDAVVVILGDGERDLFVLELWGGGEGGRAPNVAKRRARLASICRAFRLFGPHAHGRNRSARHERHERHSGGRGRCSKRRPGAQPNHHERREEDKPRNPRAPAHGNRDGVHLEGNRTVALAFAHARIVHRGGRIWQAVDRNGTPNRRFSRLGTGFGPQLAVGSGVARAVDARVRWRNRTGLTSSRFPPSLGRG